MRRSLFYCKRFETNRIDCPKCANSSKIGQQKEILLRMFDIANKYIADSRSKTVIDSAKIKTDFSDSIGQV